LGEITGEWRKIHNEEINDLHSSTNIIQIKKNGMGGACSKNGERRGVYSVWWGNMREREHLEVPGVDGRIILRRIFTKWEVGTCTGSSWHRIGTDGGHL